MKHHERAVIFDMDGVIILSGDAHWKSWQVVAERRGWTVTYESFLEGFGKVNHQVIPMMFGRPFEHAEMQALADEKEAAFVDILEGEIPLAPNTRELLEELRAQGIKTAVGTSAPPENLDLVLDGANLRHLFDASIHGADVTLGKPDPEVFLLAADRLGVAPEHCVVIEDAPVGVQAAKAAGMRAVALLTTNTRELLVGAGSDLIVDELSDLNAASVFGN